MRQGAGMRPTPLVLTRAANRRYPRCNISVVGSSWITRLASSALQAKRGVTQTKPKLVVIVSLPGDVIDQMSQNQSAQHAVQAKETKRTARHIKLQYVTAMLVNLHYTNVMRLILRIQNA